jgi:peroxiredoxin
MSLLRGVAPTMTFFRIAIASLVMSTSLGILSTRPALGQAETQSSSEPVSPRPKVLGPGAGAGNSPLQAIHDEYDRQLLQLERQRLAQMGQLAARQSPQDAAETYTQLFRLAIANNLFKDAEPFADQVLKSNNSSPVVRFLSHTTNIIATADRGAYDESLAELRAAMGEKPAGQGPGKAVAASAVLDTASLLTLCDAYYQRLIQGGRFDTARKALRMVLDRADNPTVKGFCTSRLFELGLIGQPAPAIMGTDLDGKAVNLADLKGNVVLIVFWASWCLPCSTEVAALDQAYTGHYKQGFRIVGINLDTVQGDGTPVETVMPNVRRFLLDHNIRWPNLINGAGPRDYAKAYGVSEIPSNVLVDRDGNVIHIDLSRKNIESVVTQTVGP